MYWLQYVGKFGVLNIFVTLRFELRKYKIVWFIFDVKWQTYYRFITNVAIWEGNYKYQSLKHLKKGKGKIKK